ncbi:hypothetical protein ASD48_38270 [Streptomyces sp. Root1310]|nr:hypothetical protein ASD48_38270 [Streptomyces sp. Root1310]
MREACHQLPSVIYQATNTSGQPSVPPGDVVAIAAGQRHRERDALSVDDEVVLAVRTCAVDRAGSAFGPRRAARTCEESITALDQSSWSFDRSFSSSSTCS